MFGRKTRMLQEEISRLALEIEKLKVQIDIVTQNVRSVRGQVNRKFRNTLEEDSEYSNNEGDEQPDLATLQRNLLGFK